MQCKEMLECSYMVRGIDMNNRVDESFWNVSRK
jgi:hypothetical protein